ncbi:MAG: hypothetical protein ACKOTD_03340, partial [Phycisphaerales bacterium]
MDLVARRALDRAAVVLARLRTAAGEFEQATELPLRLGALGFERNPDAWLASNNLVVIVLERMQAALDAGDRAAADALIAEAEALSERSVALAGAIDASVMANLSEVRRVQG